MIVTAESAIVLLGGIVADPMTSKQLANTLSIVSQVLTETIQERDKVIAEAKELKSNGKMVNEALEEA